MKVQVEKEIFLRAAKSHDLLTESIRMFKEYLEDKTPAADPLYYRCRNYLKEGKGFFEQTLRDAKKLLGPIPIYASPEFESWRNTVLTENKIIVHGTSIEGLTAELLDNALVKEMLSSAEVEAYIKAHFASQQEGARKLANIKIRMLLDKLSGLIEEAQELQRIAQRKQQGLPT
jgi:hypothetical protein